MYRTLLAVCSVVAAALALAAAAAASGAPTNPKDFFWAPGQGLDTAGSIQNDLIYHGGTIGDGAIGVETKPAVYLVYWGAQWGGKGFTAPDTDGKLFSSTTLQSYLNSFFANVGGTKWAGVQTQYCRNVPVGTTSCKGIAGAEYVQNPAHILKGTWTDTTPVPADIVTLGLAENLIDDPLAREAQRAAAHFEYDPNATYIIMTPPGTIGAGQPVYCGYHTQTTSIGGYGNPLRVQYAFIPFLNTDWGPALGTAGCGMHNVNAKSTAFGNGIFDGYSIVVGHEYSEAVTDPDNFFAQQDGWNDAQGSENADKCAWTNDQNITAGGRSYAIQPMWSNEAFDAGKDGCAVSR